MKIKPLKKCHQCGNTGGIHLRCNKCNNFICADCLVKGLCKDCIAENLYDKYHNQPIEVIEHQDHYQYFDMQISKTKLQQALEDHPI